METTFAAFISPRLSALDKENTQAPSALLELFYTWDVEETYVTLLVEYDSRVLPKIYDCLIVPSVKPAVVSRIFDIGDGVLAVSFVSQVVYETVVKPYVSILLSSLAVLDERTKGVEAVAAPLAQRQISTLSEIAQYSTDASQASALLSRFAPLLRKPPKFMPEKVKNNWSLQHMALFRWFAAMASCMKAARLEKFLVHILTLVYLLRDDETIRDSQMDRLKTLATELQDLMQGKVGTTKFSTTYNRIRQSALGKKGAEDSKSVAGDDEFRSGGKA